MRKTLKLSFLSFAVLAGGMLTSCSVDEGPTTSNLNNMLVKAPEFKAYSGDKEWKGNSGSFGTRTADPNANMWGSNGRYEDFPRPADITDEERAKVLAVFNEPGNESYESLVEWENFFVQHVWKGTAEYVAGNGGTVVGGDQMNKLVCGSEEMGDDHVNNFNSADGSVMLMFDSSTQRWGYSSSSDSGHIFYYFRMEFIDGAYYVGFDFSAEGQNPNEQVQRDYIYNDWIIKIVPGKSVKVEPPTTDTDQEQPEEPEDRCPKCEHPNHGDDVCDKCTPGEQCGETPAGGDEVDDNNGDDNDNDEGETPGDIVKKGINEVEVNLHGDDKGDYLESHLSIHVRHATDVEVYIPVPKQYYCDADDLVISQIHDMNHSKHGGPYKVTYELKDDKEDVSYTVTLNLEFVEDGIRIWTEGITQEVIDFCFNHYQDGLNFEVWSYFNNTIDLEGLKEYLNQATVRFLTDEPDAYINAFAEEGGAKNPDDCTVSIVKEQSGDFEDAVTGEHLNGSHFNEIYANKNAGDESQE